VHGIVCPFRVSWGYTGDPVSSCRLYTLSSQTRTHQAIKVSTPADSWPAGSGVLDPHASRPGTGPRPPARGRRGGALSIKLSRRGRRHGVEAREAEHHPARSTSVPRRPHAEITVAPQHPCGSVRSGEGRARDGRHTSFVQAFEVQENLVKSHKVSACYVCLFQFDFFKKNRVYTLQLSQKSIFNLQL